MTTRQISSRRVWAVLACAVLLTLTACTQSDKVPVSYYAVNETNKDIDSIIVNGEGGILDARAHADGGEMCCVVIPRRWRPGLTATIKWQQDGHWIRDDKGNIVEKDGHKLFAEGTWQEQSVAVPEYGEKLGMFYIHFLPGNQVKVLVSLVGPAHPDYQFPTADKASSR